MSVEKRTSQGKVHFDNYECNCDRICGQITSKTSLQEVAFSGSDI